MFHKNLNDPKKNDDYQQELPKETTKLKESSQVNIKEKADEGQVNQFGRDQMLTICQFCQSKIYTCTEHQTTWIGICLSIMLFLIFRIYSIFLIVLLIPLTQSTIHTCPNCLNTIGVRSFYDILSLTDKVLTFQLFSLGIIITKKQLLAFFIFVFFMILFYICFSSIDFVKHCLPDTWDDFSKLCPKERMINQRVNLLCKEKYLYQEVSWTGYAIRVDFDERFFSRYRAHVLVKMVESQNEEPELFLKFTDTNYNKYKMDILNTTRGDLIQFNATIMFEGSMNNVPVIEANAYKKLDKKIFINPHVHNTGRYSTADQMLEREGSLYSELPGLVRDNEFNEETEK